MSKVRVAGFSISLDGFSAGIEQSMDHPLGKRDPELFQWFFHTRSFCAMQGKEGGSADVDDAFARRLMETFGAPAARSGQAVFVQVRMMKVFLKI